jgi:hypothetical protein
VTDRWAPLRVALETDDPLRFIKPTTIAALLAERDALEMALLQIAGDLDDAAYPAIKVDRLRNIARAAVARADAGEKG